MKAANRLASTRCRRCERLRLLVGFVLLAVALGLALHAAAVAPAASAPVAAAPASAASAPLAMTVAPTASAPADMRLIYKTVALPSGRLGVAYGPRQVVQGGMPPYRFTVDGKLPPGLQLADDGRLAGLPSAAGRYTFVLGVHDASSPPLAAQQAYVLYIDKATAARPASAPSAPAALTALSRADADATANLSAGVPVSYKLTQADVATLMPEDAAPAPEPAPAPAESAPAAAPAASAAAMTTVPAGPSAEQLQAILAPMIDVEYPTLALFVKELEAERCAYYAAHVKEAALKKGLAVDARCPPDAPPPAARKANAGGIPLRQFYDDLLPPQNRDAIVKAAEKLHPFTDAKPLKWAGGGCACSPTRTDNEVIAFIPYWLAGETALPVDFSLFTRLQYMGVVLNDNGTYLRPPGWDSRGGGFAREARRHGTRLDLVLYRRDWASLLALPEAQRDTVAHTAARNAVALADTRRDDLQTELDGLMLPAWQESAYVYDGITVFFEDSPTDAVQQKAYARFLHLMLQRLVAEMQATQRRYHLNIVVPDHLLGDDGPYDFQHLMEVLESAEPKRTSKGVEEGAKVRYRGITDITVDFFVLLSEPTAQSKIDLRARVDNTPSLSGHRRIAFLESAVPFQFYRRGDKPTPLPPDEREQLDKDLAYIKWTFGGIGFWPVPTVGAGSGEGVHELASHNYGVPRGAMGGLCAFVCPNRMPLRLLFEALLLAEAIAIGLYAWNCRVRRLGARYLLALWAGALATLLLAFGIFTCDPALYEWREQNYLLYALILALFAAGAYATFKPRVEAP